MSSLRVEGLSGINLGLRGRQLRASGPIPQGLILSRNFRTSEGPKTRAEMTLQVPQAALYHSPSIFCLGPEPFVRTPPAASIPGSQFACKTEREGSPSPDDCDQKILNVSCLTRCPAYNRCPINADPSFCLFPFLFLYWNTPGWQALVYFSSS